MSKKNEKIKAEMSNDIRKTAKQDKLKIQIRRRIILKVFAIFMALVLLVSLIMLIISSRKVKVKAQKVQMH